MKIQSIRTRVFEWKDKTATLFLILSFLLMLSTNIFADDKKDPYQEGLERDAQTIADIYHIPYKDALRRLKLQATASDKLVVQLKEEFKERFAGIYIEHHPVDRLVVRLKGDTDITDRTMNVDGDLLIIKFISGQSYTKAELQEALSKNRNELKTFVKGLQGTYTDDRTGEAVLDVYMEKNDPIKINELRRTCEDILKVPVRIDRISSKIALQAASVRGGGILVEPGCTTGFPVKNKNTSIKGITTAAHCGTGNATFTDGNGNNSLLQYQAGIFNGTEDVQWYTAVTFPPFIINQVEPKFYADSDINPRTLTGRRTRASTHVGNNVCHRGRTTGYSCGDVSATDYDNAVCNGVCTPTWIRVNAPQTTEPGLACYGGDSGGPWFISTVALGIHHAGDANSLPWIGACNFAIYMSTDYIDALDLQLFYGQ